jgi:hypothetical protein
MIKTFYILGRGGEGQMGQKEWKKTVKPNFKNISEEST